MKKITSFLILIQFLIMSILPEPGFSQGLAIFDFLPKTGAPMALSYPFSPAQLQGMIVHPTDPFNFDFIIHRGDETLSPDQKTMEYTKLIKYFLTALTVPDDEQWVNLSPYEKESIIPDSFGRTEMGRDLLAQDYLLKQITASLSHPNTKLGKTFWDNVYARAYQQLGTTNIPTDVFNKIWITPDHAEVYETGHTMIVLKYHLKVLLESDYNAMQNNTTANTADSDVVSISKDVMRQIILPVIEKEVNEGKNFALLRQVYSGMLLATWYKMALKESLLSTLYTDKRKVKGIDQDPGNNQVIYDRYVEAFHKGVVNLIKEDEDAYSKETLPRKYFSGGAGNDFSQSIHLRGPSDFHDNSTRLANIRSESDIVSSNMHQAHDRDFASLSSQITQRIQEFNESHEQLHKHITTNAPDDSLIEIDVRGKKIFQANKAHLRFEDIKAMITYQIGRVPFVFTATTHSSKIYINITPTTFLFNNDLQHGPEWTESITQLQTIIVPLQPSQDESPAEEKTFTSFRITDNKDHLHVAWNYPYLIALSDLFVIVPQIKQVYGPNAFTSTHKKEILPGGETQHIVTLKLDQTISSPLQRSQMHPESIFSLTVEGSPAAEFHNKFNSLRKNVVFLNLFIEDGNTNLVYSGLASGFTALYNYLNDDFKRRYGDNLDISRSTLEETGADNTKTLTATISVEKHPENVTTLFATWKSLQISFEIKKEGPFEAGWQQVRVSSILIGKERFRFPQGDLVLNAGDRLFYDLYVRKFFLHSSTYGLRSYDFPTENTPGPPRLTEQNASVETAENNKSSYKPLKETTSLDATYEIWGGIALSPEKNLLLVNSLLNPVSGKAFYSQIGYTLGSEGWPEKGVQILRPASPNVSTSTGGIDLRQSSLNFLIRRNDEGMPLPINQQNQDNIHFDGLVPVIVNIQPAANLSGLSTHHENSLPSF